MLLLIQTAQAKMVSLMYNSLELYNDSRIQHGSTRNLTRLRCTVHRVDVVKRRAG